MARAGVVEGDAYTDRAALLASPRSLPAQAGRPLVPLARYGNESAAARSGTDPMKVDEAYAECRRIAHKHGANFSVGFRFLPPIKRRAVYAAYAWCRWADDIADEPGENILPRLDAWQRELDACYAGSPSHPITIALG